MNTKNKIYENQKDCEIIPINIEINKVWIIKIIPSVNGWFKLINNRDIEVNNKFNKCNIKILKRIFFIYNLQNYYFIFKLLK